MPIEAILAYGGTVVQQHQRTGITKTVAVPREKFTGLETRDAAGYYFDLMMQSQMIPLHEALAVAPWLGHLADLTDANTPIGLMSDANSVNHTIPFLAAKIAFESQRRLFTPDGIIAETTGTDIGILEGIITRTFTFDIAAGQALANGTERGVRRIATGSTIPDGQERSDAPRHMRAIGVVGQSDIAPGTYWLFSEGPNDHLSQATALLYPSPFAQKRDPRSDEEAMRIGTFESTSPRGGIVVPLLPESAKQSGPDQQSPTLSRHFTDNLDAREVYDARMNIRVHDIMLNPGEETLGMIRQQVEAGVRHFILLGPGAGSIPDSIQPALIYLARQHPEVTFYIGSREKSPFAATDSQEVEKLFALNDQLQRTAFVTLDRANAMTATWLIVRSQLEQKGPFFSADSAQALIYAFCNYAAQQDAFDPRVHVNDLVTPY